VRHLITGDLRHERKAYPCANVTLT
jgi:hypothetical protein